MILNPKTDGARPLWFVMVAYKREFAAEQELQAAGLEAWVPRQTVVRTRLGRTTRRQEPAIATVVFVRGPWASIMEAKRRMDYLKFRMATAAACDYLVVPDRQMDDFRRVCRLAEDKLQYLAPSEVSLRAGTRVRIIGGPLDGVEGAFQRVQGKRARRLVVALDGFCGVAAEVEPDFIQVL